MKDGYKVLGRLYKTFFLSGGVTIFLEKIRVRICGFFDICNRLRRLREGLYIAIFIYVIGCVGCARAYI